MKNPEDMTKDELIGSVRALRRMAGLGALAASCPKCPHCIARGAFGLIDPKDPALTTNLPPKKSKAKRCSCGHVARAHAKGTGDCWAVVDGGARDCVCKKFKEAA